MSSTQRTLLVLALLLAGIAVVRAPHMRGPIDDPHSWRQCVTAYSARVFYEEGIDLLHPKVCWMGDYRLTAFEFPLYGAAVALGYRVFGERIGIARIVTLLSFLGSAAYLFAILRYVYGTSLAATATAIYGLLPIGLFYSRAVHPDPSTILAAHGMVYHFLRAYDEKKRFHVAAGAAWALCGFLFRASHVFYFALPLMAWIAARFDRRSFLLLVLASCPAVAAFLLWRRHCFVMHSAAPDWFFIPGYHKHTDMALWYYGPLKMRFRAQPWLVLGDRFVRDVASHVGTALFVLGMGAGCVRGFRPRREMLFAWTWLAGATLYILVFFNPNVVHNYYQLPLLAVVALFIAFAVEWLARALGAWRWPRFWSWAIPCAAVLAVGTNSVARAEGEWYRVDGLRLEAANFIKSMTPKESLVIASTELSGFPDPRLLHYSRRDGWSIDVSQLSLDSVEALRTKAGAQFLFVLTSQEKPPGSVSGWIRFTFPMQSAPWFLHCYRLNGTPEGPVAKSS